MTKEFERSNWARTEFGREYVDTADICVVERRRTHAILKSYYLHFIKDGGQKEILDLGCGDGVLAHEILKADAAASATLVDGSEDMLVRARQRLKGFVDTRFVRATFQEVFDRGDIGSFDFVMSSLAIHHLDAANKKSLFSKIHSRLKTGGHFLNIDVVLAPSEPLEKWYLALWQEWISEKKIQLDIQGSMGDDIVFRYKDNRDNKPDTLDDQMQALKEIGFRDVDCFYKYGIFVIYGGVK